MANPDSLHLRWTPRLLSVLRIIAAFLLIPHGAQKLFGFLATPGMPSAGAFSLMWVAGGGEWAADRLIGRGRAAYGDR